jgi:hypothetical protein
MVEDAAVYTVKARICVHLDEYRRRVGYLCNDDDTAIDRERRGGGEPCLQPDDDQDDIDIEQRYLYGGPRPPEVYNVHSVCHAE